MPAKSRKLTYNPLEMIVSGDTPDPVSALTDLDPAEILPNPHQPRTYLDPHAQAELEASIRDAGIHEPLIVRPQPDGSYQLVAGGRRLAAARVVGLATVPVVIREYTDEQAEQVALVENLQRSSLRFDDEAHALQRLKRRFALTNELIGRSIGKSTDYVELRIAAAEHPHVLAMYMNREIEQNQIRAAIKDARAQGQNPKASDFAAPSAERLPHHTVPRRPSSPGRDFTRVVKKLYRIGNSWQRLDSDEQESYIAHMNDCFDALIEAMKVAGVRIDITKLKDIAASQLSPPTDLYDNRTFVLNIDAEPNFAHPSRTGSCVDCPKRRPAHRVQAGECHPARDCRGASCLCQ